MAISMMRKERAESFIVEMRDDDDKGRCCCLLLVVRCSLLDVIFVCLYPNLSPTKIGFSGCLGMSTGVPVKRNK